MSLGPLLPAGGGGPCLICGGTECAPAPDVIHPESYPFLPGGRPVAQGTEGVDFVTTVEAVVDRDRNRIVYVAGSRVPIDDAVKYGLIDKPARRSKRGPAEDRAKKASSTRKAAAKKR